MVADTPSRLYVELPRYVGPIQNEGMARLALAKVLKRKKLSKRQFAIRLGMDPKHTPRFFRKGYNPTLKTMERWAKAIGCRIRDLIEE